MCPKRLDLIRRNMESSDQWCWLLMHFELWVNTGCRVVHLGKLASLSLDQPLFKLNVTDMMQRLSWRRGKVQKKKRWATWWFNSHSSQCGCIFLPGKPIRWPPLDIHAGVACRFCSCFMLGQQCNQCNSVCELVSVQWIHGFQKMLWQSKQLSTCHIVSATIFFWFVYRPIDRWYCNDRFVWESKLRNKVTETKSVKFVQHVLLR